MGMLHIEHPENVWIQKPTQETLNQVICPLRRIIHGVVNLRTLEDLASTGILTPKWDGSPAYHVSGSRNLWYGRKAVDPVSGTRFADRHGQYFTEDASRLPLGSIIECVVDNQEHQNIIHYTSESSLRIAVVPNKSFESTYLNRFGWEITSGVKHWTRTVKYTGTRFANLWRDIGEMDSAIYFARLLFSWDQHNMPVRIPDPNTRQKRMIKGLINRRFEAGIHEIGERELKNQYTNDIFNWLIKHELDKVSSTRGEAAVHRDAEVIDHWLDQIQSETSVLDIADQIACIRDHAVSLLTKIQSGYHDPVINPVGGRHEGWVWWETNSQPLKLVDRTWFARMNREVHDHEQK